MALSKTTSEKSADSSTTKTTGVDRKERPFTKVIVRRLPPNMSQEEFLNQVSPIPDYDYIYSVKGDISLGENAFTRVYINFVQIDDVYLFKEKFDNYVFLDEKGHEYSAVVEFAPFQKIPKLRKKPKTDPKSGSIETDQIYIDFVNSLNESIENQDEKPEFSYQPTVDAKNEINTTPLLDFLKQRKLERQKLREEKRDERRRKDLERKRIRDEERKKRMEEKSSPKKDNEKPSNETTSGDFDEQGTKASVVKSSTSEGYAEHSDLSTKENKNFFPKEERAARFKEKRYEEKSFVNSKLKKQHKQFDEKKEIRNRRDREEYKSKEFKNKGFEHKTSIPDKREPRDPEPRTEPLKVVPRKVKKYSERREERKIEAKRASQNEHQSMLDLLEDKSTEKLAEYTLDTELEPSSSSTSDLGGGNKENKEGLLEEEIFIEPTQREERFERKTFKNRDNDPRAQRRIRNKDRPTMALYQPGMLKKKSDPSTSNADDGSVKEE